MEQNYNSATLKLIVTDLTGASTTDAIATFEKETVSELTTVVREEL